MNIAVECWLIVATTINPYGRSARRPVVRVSKGKPNLKGNEVAIKLNLGIPASLFSRPQLQARIEIPEEAAPYVIESSVVDNITAAIREASGFNVRLEVGAPEENKE